VPAGILYCNGIMLTDLMPLSIGCMKIPGTMANILGVFFRLRVVCLVGDKPGSLPAPTRERIALAVAEVNGCGYCLLAHTYLGKNVAKLNDAEMTANRNGASNDPKADAAVRFAAKIVQYRGRISQANFQGVALNTWTNYMNEVAGTEIDFPVVQPKNKT